jgi:hypothetical protein
VPVIIEGLCKSLGIGQLDENSGVGPSHARRHVHFTFDAVDKAHKQPKAW